MKQIIYSPQPNATLDEVMQVLKVFTVSSLPPYAHWFDKETGEEYGRGEVLLRAYEALPPEAKRHFRVVENGK